MDRKTLYAMDVDYLIDEIENRLWNRWERMRKEEEKRRKAELDPTYYTRKEAADKLRISVAALHTHINNGYIPAYNIGGRTLIKAQDLNKSLIRQNH